MRFIHAYLLSLAVACGAVAIMFAGLSLINELIPLSTGFDMRAIKILLASGMGLWHLSNWACPPFGERCFLGSESQGMHHLWGLICYGVGWQVIFLIALPQISSRVGLNTDLIRGRPNTIHSG